MSEATTSSSVTAQFRVGSALVFVDSGIVTGVDNAWIGRTSTAACKETFRDDMEYVCETGKARYGRSVLQKVKAADFDLVDG